MTEKIEYMSLTELVPFKNHPFKMRDGTEQEQILESIKAQGMIEPLIVRSSSDGKHEVISGHRRLAVCKELGIENVPVIVRNLTDEQAVAMMVDSNIHRENLLPSEKAFAYRMKLEAVKRQGKRSDLTSTQVGQKLLSVEELAQQTKESRSQVQRYIRLTYLGKPILDLVDEGRIALTPAVELSYLQPEEQQDLFETICSEDCTPSLSQAIRMRKLSAEGLLSMDRIFEIMTEEKANQVEYLKLQAGDV